ncbi:unnamed protein product [Lathyrus sativus]|nr:unnamed protein product [Lathyrus sativus]
MVAPIPHEMEKPPTLSTYDGTSDPDDHLEDIEAMLDYRNVRGGIKCRLFPTTLRKGAMTWYKSLEPESITSWRVLKDLFLKHFTASRRHPKTEAALGVIIQAPDEPLRKYIERFTREAVQVTTSDEMKRYLMEQGLH